MLFAISLVVYFGVYRSLLSLVVLFFRQARKKYNDTIPYKFSTQSSIPTHQQLHPEGDDLFELPSWSRTLYLSGYPCDYVHSGRNAMQRIWIWLQLLRIRLEKNSPSTGQTITIVQSIIGRQSSAQLAHAKTGCLTTRQV